MVVARYIDASVFDEINATMNVGFTAVLETGPDAGGVSDIKDLLRNEQHQIEWIIGDSQNQAMLKILSQLSPRGFDDSLISAPIMLSTAVAILIWTLVFYLLRHYLISPLIRVAVHLVTVRKSGDYSLRMDEDRRSDEIGVLDSECNALLGHVHQQSERLTLLSLSDALTGIANRRKFDNSMDDNWALLMRNKAQLGLLICDIDNFKLYNDHYGHPAGDVTLQEVAKVIASCVHRDADLAARVGGEEFALLLPMTDLEGCKCVANRVLRAMQSLAIPHEYSVLDIVSLSIGIVAVIPPRATTPKPFTKRQTKHFIGPRKMDEHVLRRLVIRYHSIEDRIGLN